jgi:glycosyltransferase involved in cell wall biosynthesis
MDFPLISVIIPVYNGEQTIAETIASLLQQTYSNWELIVINDGSSDRTPALVQDILAQHPQIQGGLLSYPQTGACASRNRGAAQAQGKFLAFLDADDLWTADKLALQLQALQSSPHAKIAYSWTDYIDIGGKFLYPGGHATHEGDVYKYLLLGNFLENGSNALICRDAFRQVGGFDESVTGVDEWDLFIRMTQQTEFACEFVVVPQVQIFYRLSNQSLSASIDRQASECRKVIDQAFQTSPAHLQHLKPKSLANLYRYLTFRGLSSDLAYSHPRLLMQYFLKSLFWDPQELIPRWKLMAIVGLKLLITLLLPKVLARKLITAYQRKNK